MVRLYIAVVCSYGEALADRIVSYRDILSDIVSYLLFSLMAVSCHHYLNVIFKRYHRQVCRRFTPVVGAPRFVNSKQCGIDVVRPAYIGKLSHDRL